MDLDMSEGRQAQFFHTAIMIPTAPPRQERFWLGAAVNPSPAP